MLEDKLPLIEFITGNEPIAWYEGQPVSRKQFLADAAHVASQLPDTRQVINLCSDRYGFMVTFAAAMIRGQLTLLPPSRTPEVINEIANEFEAPCLCDKPVEGLDQPAFSFSLTCKSAKTTETAPTLIPYQRPAILAFTSGSTGKARPYSKTWGQLVTGTHLALSRFGMQSQAHHLVATVPPQHMYGLESTVLYAMLGPNTVHAGQPFYPEDIRNLLTQMPSPFVLVTTPIHLRAMTRAGLNWPKPAFLLCATAPLDRTLAAESELAFGAPLYEIYGFTEAGAVASRQPTQTQDWHLYEGMKLTRNDKDWAVSGPQLEQAQQLTDSIECNDGVHFSLLGRKSELVNIAGKRTTIGELNYRLLSITGVIDGCFIQPDPSSERLAALVVAPELDTRSLLQSLGRSIDPVFLPRPLIKLATLPRMDTGKLERETVLALIDGARLSA